MKYIFQKWEKIKAGPFDDDIIMTLFQSNKILEGVALDKIICRQKKTYFYPSINSKKVFNSLILLLSVY